MESARGHTSNRMLRKQINCRNGNDITESWLDKEYEKKKDFPELEKGPEANIHIESLRVTLKKVTNWIKAGHDGIHELSFEIFASIHDRLALELSKYLKETSILELMTKGKITLIQKSLKKEI